RYLHSTRAELLRRLGRTDEARTAYRRARDLTDDGAERRFLERRLTELARTTGSGSGAAAPGGIWAGGWGPERPIRQKPPARGSPIRACGDSCYVVCRGVRDGGGL